MEKGYFQSKKRNYRIFFITNVILDYLYLNIIKTVSPQLSLCKMQISTIKLTLKMKNLPCYLLFKNTPQTLLEKVFSMRS